ncbi:hypothetical protein B0J11DRAFT_593912 [Dendryphion nanum]|uniref:ATPase AAA-type core domain-containing protein n=1 Tax=Dendryphion nanum TaxID=256645 RepID=A0A9P9ICV5_9PLEO|nr:hypothetical protein B0J11DRAFT_593912 [Dendryphion nanum]
MGNWNPPIDDEDETDEYLYGDNEAEPDTTKIEQETELPVAVEKGGKCELKAVYHVPVKGKPNTFHWIDHVPTDYGIETDSTKTKQEREAYAILNYQKFDHEESRWDTSSIFINSTKIRTVLEKVLEGYPGLTQHELKTFSPPFLPFFHRWNTFLSSIENEKDELTLKHLNLLRETLEPRMQDTFRIGDEIEKTGHVAFDDLKLAFLPADTAFHSFNGLIDAGTLRDSTFGYDQCSGRRYFDVTVDVVDWDGRRCGLLADTWTIWEYHGLRALTALDVSPLRINPDKESIKAKLVARGRTFEKLRGQFFMAYSDPHNERINERTIIDARSYHKFSYSRETFPHFAKLSEIGPLTWAQSMNRYSSNPGPNSKDPMKLALAPLTDHECMLAVSTVKCFNIETKKWAQLDLTKFHEIPWSEQAFDSLVLDESEKDLLIALIDRDEYKNSKAFDDFITGKVKTRDDYVAMWATWIAEHLRRPLYKLGAGDLGITASSVEKCLDKALKLCSHWGAVLLIDEADVFMEARSANNLQRNELVSVFLRLLEYYNGIMILTTNRMQSIDTAFESRVDITLTYNPLTEDDRKQVWRNFIRKFNAKDIDIDEAALDKLSKWDFNGRQIKSAIKTARILAAKKKVPLNADHLNVVLNLRDKALRMTAAERDSANDL